MKRSFADSNALFYDMAYGVYLNLESFQHTMVLAVITTLLIVGLLFLVILLIRYFRKLSETVTVLKLSEDKLQLLLDSVAEGIIAINKEGICTYCNRSCLDLLGYSTQEQILGKSFHYLINHSNRDGTAIPYEENNILSIFTTGIGVSSENEVFWRGDGSCFDVGYISNPEYKDGEIQRLVVTFLNIAERKEVQRSILYQNYHDELTGLYNRRYFEEEFGKMNSKENLPISIIVGDVNGLKQTNDIFGHAKGDILIKAAAKIIEKNCSSKGICIRVGGDEFLMVLPNTSTQDAKIIAKRIREEFMNVVIEGFQGSISLGISTKLTMDEDIIHIIDSADSNMYSQKTLDHKKFNDKAVTVILERLHELCPWEKTHSSQVSKLCQILGQKMELSVSEIRRLVDAAYYHDIGKIIMDPATLNKSEMLTKHEMHLMRRHPIVGYRILNLSDKTLDIAKYVLSHHERWDGKGYPNRLKGDGIPKLSRIITIADAYILMRYGSNYKKSMSEEDAIQEILRNKGKQFDPEIVDVFIELINDSELI